MRDFYFLFIRELNKRYFYLKKPDRIPYKYLILFFEELSMLLSSGVLISDSLECLALRFPHAKTQVIIRDIYKQVVDSKYSLSQAFSQYPKSFPASIIAVIEAGEQGGSSLLAQRFKDLSERISYEQSLRSQINRACAYPLLVVLLSLGLYGILLEVVFPRLADLLRSLGSDLPPLAKAIILFATISRRIWPFFLSLTILLPILIIFARKSSKFKKIIDKWFLRLPIIGEIYCFTKASLVCRVFKSLYICNQPTPYSLDLCIKLITNDALKSGLIRARFDITQNGSMLSTAFAKTGLFPPLACLAIEIGERTGKIAPALDRVSEYLAKQAKDRLEIAIAVINPILTLTVVAVAGIMLISFFQASYQIIYATK